MDFSEENLVGKGVCVATLIKHTKVVETKYQISHSNLDYVCDEMEDEYKDALKTFKRTIPQKEVAFFKHKCYIEMVSNTTTELSKITE